MVNHWVLLTGILLFVTNCGADSICDQKFSLYYLDAAIDFIGKAKNHLPPSVNVEKSFSRNALDCSDLLEIGYKKNGIYKIWPISRILDDKPLEVYCDMETDGGGWTVIQRRGSFGRGEDYFYKDWKRYKEGFGNDNIFSLTNQRLYSARFDLKALSNETRYAHYDRFWIDDEYNKYTLHIADYRGNAGDSMAWYHNNQKFSTKDEDNDNGKAKSCVEKYRGGWWYNTCCDANLNGFYLKDKREIFGIFWNKWIKPNESLQATEIKIRPGNFKLSQDTLSNTPL